MSNSPDRVAIRPRQSSNWLRCCICNTTTKDHSKILLHIVEKHIDPETTCKLCQPLKDTKVVAHGNDLHGGHCPICGEKPKDLAEHFKTSCCAVVKAGELIREGLAHENANVLESGQSASCKEVFSAQLHPVPQLVQDSMPGFGPGSWVQQDFGGQHESLINVEDFDLNLLTYFIDKVSKLFFPIRIASQHSSARADVVWPALKSNKAYLHCCLSVAATHMKATERCSSEEMDKHILRHRRAAVSELCGQLSQNVGHARMLEATLGMIYFECSVGRHDDVPPDIPWHEHFKVASGLVQRLELPSTVVSSTANGTHAPLFNMALTSWIDILGATMIGKAPTFADTYRELNLRQQSAGLAKLMGCNDRIMFLISEIACLEVSKADGLDWVVLSRYVKTLAAAIIKIYEILEKGQTCFSLTGAIRSEQLNINISALFCVAARIYLCTLETGIELHHPLVCGLISTVTNVMALIPAGVERSLVWPLLMAGSMSMADSPFRSMFAKRCKALGDAANFGSFGRMRKLLEYVWRVNDRGRGQTSTNQPIICWREKIGGNCLLI